MALEFSVTEERLVNPPYTTTVPGYERTIRRINGPCLICEQEIEYVAGWPYDEDHARKQFAPRRRKRLIKTLRGTGDRAYPKIATIQSMVCPSCRAECRPLREAANRQWQSEQQAEYEAREREEKAREQRRLACERHYSWRTVTAAEVDRKPHSAEFRAVFPNFELHEILFRWRATTGQCRGESYLMKVGMWVDGKLTAHYYEWNLQRLFADDDRLMFMSEHTWGTRDLFARGFCRWIERAFQPRLLRLKPDLTYRPGQYQELDSQMRRPGVVRIEWFDGASYVHLLPSLDLPVVAEWALEKLELRIEECVRAFRPVVGEKTPVQEE